MGLESIIGFIIIAVVSSLFNKENTARKRQAGRGQTTTTPDTYRPTTVTKTSATGMDSRRNFTGSLGDIFNDIKAEIDKNFGEESRTQSPMSPQPQTPIEGKVVKDNRRLGNPNNSVKETTKKYESTVYDGEIGSNEILLEFNEKSIIQGIIMSEVLQKPKSLRR